MVRVFYEPPPYGPKTCLNRTGYGVHGGGLFGDILERAAKTRPGLVMAVPVVAICALCYLPLGTFKKNYYYDYQREREREIRCLSELMDDFFFILTACSICFSSFTRNQSI